MISEFLYGLIVHWLANTVGHPLVFFKPQNSILNKGDSIQYAR